MANTTISRKNSNHDFNDHPAAPSDKQSAKDKTVDVLYQKLGGKWYAFTVIDDEVFMGSLNPESLDPKHNQ